MSDKREVRCCWRLGGKNEKEQQVYADRFRPRPYAWAFWMFLCVGWLSFYFGYKLERGINECIPPLVVTAPCVNETWVPGYSVAGYAESRPCDEHCFKRWKSGDFTSADATTDYAFFVALKPRSNKANKDKYFDVFARHHDLRTEAFANVQCIQVCKASRVFNQMYQPHCTDPDTFVSDLYVSTDSTECITLAYDDPSYCTAGAGDGVQSTPIIDGVRWREGEAMYFLAAQDSCVKKDTIVGIGKKAQKKLIPHGVKHEHVHVVELAEGIDFSWLRGRHDTLTVTGALQFVIAGATENVTYTQPWLQNLPEGLPYDPDMA